MTGMTDLSARARSFLSGEALTLQEATNLWDELQKNNEISTARAVLARIREDDSLLDRSALTVARRRQLLQQEAIADEQRSGAQFGHTSRSSPCAPQPGVRSERRIVHRFRDARYCRRNLQAALVRAWPAGGLTVCRFVL